MLIEITYKGIKFDCEVGITITIDPLQEMEITGRPSPTEYDIEYEWISLKNNSTEDLMPILVNDLDKINDLIIAAYRGV